MSVSVFMRQEEKYLLRLEQANRLLESLGTRLEPDRMSANAQIDNLYLDTPEQVLIRRSLEKPDYKEKLRIRSYGFARLSGEENSENKERRGEQPVFLELKKKYLGTVYKRRVGMSYSEARRFVTSGALPRSPLCSNGEQIALNQQILGELSRALDVYQPLQPAIRLDYRRAAFCYTAEDNSRLRMTLDSDLHWALGSWEHENAGERLLAEDECVLEIKVVGTMPRLLAQTLNVLGIYPRSFSKVGRAYEKLLEKGNNYDR